MKASIDKDGALVLSAETETESYAIGCWLKIIPELRVIHNGIGTIHYDIPNSAECYA